MPIAEASRQRVVRAQERDTLEVGLGHWLTVRVRIVNYAHVEDAISDHHRYADWLVRMATGLEPFALSVLVLSGFLRIVTNPRVFDPPSTLDTAFAGSSRRWPLRSSRANDYPSNT